MSSSSAPLWDASPVVVNGVLLHLPGSRSELLVCEGAEDLVEIPRREFPRMSVDQEMRHAVARHYVNWLLADYASFCLFVLIAWTPRPGCIVASGKKQK